MEIMIANKITGEVVAYYGEGSVSKGIAAIRGYIRTWFKCSEYDFSLSSFEILKSSSHKLYYHIHNYAWGLDIHDCDICGTPIPNKERVFCEDNEGVCLVAGCHDCLGH